MAIKKNKKFFVQVGVFYWNDKTKERYWHKNGFLSVFFLGGGIISLTVTFAANSANVFKSPRSWESCWHFINLKQGEKSASYLLIYHLVNSSWISSRIDFPSVNDSILDVFSAKLMIRCYWKSKHSLQVKSFKLRLSLI